MFVREVQPDRIIMGNLDAGLDLLLAFEDICREHQIRLGHLQAIGAVSKARIGYFQQGNKEYHYNTIERPLEITGLMGNISLKDSQPFVHAHLTLGDDEGRILGGHLASGTMVFACEYLIQVFKGPEFNRIHDRQTGLSLWGSIK